MKINKSFIKGALMGALITFGSLGYFGITTGMINILNYNNEDVITADVQEKIQRIDSLIDKYFLYDIDEDQLKDMIYAGYVAGLGDIYSTYYNAEDTQLLLESTSGEYSGVGAQMSQHIASGVITITNVFEDSPAMIGGICDGDILYKVDGEDISEQELTVVVSKIKGAEGTEVELTVLRGSDLEEITTTITRQVIQNPTVYTKVLDEGIGYIEVSQFETVTVEQFSLALEEMENAGTKGLIIDLRNNPGGTLNSVCEMLDMLLPKGLLVYTEDKYGNREEQVAKDDDRYDQTIAVLVNEYSASASEIFAGVLQDKAYGVIVGTNTYGKGVVQQLMDLGDGTTIKLTTSEYFTSSGRQINKVGVIPDIEVIPTSEDEGDLQLEAAIEIFK